MSPFRDRRWITVLTRPDHAFEALRELGGWSEEIHVAYAWASSNGGSDDHWCALPLDKVRRAVVGIHFAQTEPHVPNSLAQRRGIVGVIEDTSGVFYPKVLVGLQRHRAQTVTCASDRLGEGWPVVRDLRPEIARTSPGPLNVKERHCY